MDKVFKFEELTVYQKSLTFIDEIYNTSSLFPKIEQFGLSNQLQRAATSIALNIAEGSSRTKKDFQHFLAISRGSCFECAAILQIAYMRNYMNKDRYVSLFAEVATLSKMITALKNLIQIQKIKQPSD